MNQSQPSNEPQAALSPQQVNALALQLLRAQDRATLLALPSTSHPGLSAADGYAIAAQLQQLRLQSGGVCVGRKIGFTNPELWDTYGVRAPIWGPMYRHTVLSFAQWKDGFSLQKLVQAKLEPEVVLHFQSAPAAGASAAELLACVDWVAHGFEMVQCHYANWQFTPADAIADGSLHGALLLGPPVPVSSLGATPEGRLLALQSLQLGLYRNNTWVQDGQGSNVLGSPVLAAAHLLALLQEQGLALQAGETITTGTLTAAYAVQAGEQWHTVLKPAAVAQGTDNTVKTQGLGGLQVSFTS